MAVSLVKEYGIPFRGFLSQATLDEYRGYVLQDHLTAVYGDHGQMIYRHLSHNCLNSMAVLIMYRDAFDNVTGKIDFDRLERS